MKVFGVKRIILVETFFFYQFLGLRPFLSNLWIGKWDLSFNSFYFYIILKKFILDNGKSSFIVFLVRSIFFNFYSLDIDYCVRVLMNVSYKLVFTRTIYWRCRSGSMELFYQKKK